MPAPADNAEAPCAARVTLRPEPSVWLEALRSPSTDDNARAFRRGLGLPEDLPIVMSGHQAGFWHAGILAKRFALQACADAAGAHPAWLVVDHDTNDAGAVRYPAKDAEGRLVDRTLRIAPKGAAPTGRLDAADAPEIPTDSAEPFVLDGLRAIAGALTTAESPAESLAAQVHAAAESLADAGAVSTVFSTNLAQTTLFGELLEYIASDPERCRETFNEAVKGTSVRPLMPGDLPLWDLSGPVRRRVRDDDLTTIDRQSLAPAAILQTMLLRAAGCDLFIHGTGGGGTEDDEGYENATSRWHASWSPPLGDLAPITVATATLTLPLAGGAGVPDDEEVAELVWRSHHLRHEPQAEADKDRKRAILQKIEHAPRNSAARAEQFATLHNLLDEHRRSSAEAIAQADKAAERARARRRDAELINDRTWPFPLHPAASLGALRKEIRSCFGL